MSARTTFINTLDMLQHSLALVTVVTPEKTYKNVNVVHHEITRSAEKGVTLLQANVWLNEIRLGATTKYSNTKTPAAADPVCTGAVQPIPYYNNPLPQPQ